MNAARGDHTGETVDPMTLEHLRDSIVDSFAEQHGPRFGETRAALGLDDGEEAVLDSIRGIVKLAYTLAGGSFDEPNTATTTRVLNLLSERSAVWGVSEDKVFQAHSDMMRKLGLIILAEAEAGGPPKD